MCCPPTSRLRLMALLAVGLLMVQSCGGQPKPVSLNEAQKTAVALGKNSGGFVPPPRTLDDVMAEIKSAKPVDPARTAELRALLASIPPAGAGDGTLAEYYFDRGDAASILGLYDKALADGEMAYTHAVAAFGQDIRWHNKRNYYGAVIWPSLYLGDTQRAAQMLLESAKNGNNCSKGVMEYANLARIHYWSGDLTQAEQYRQQFQAAWSHMPGECRDTYKYVRRNTVESVRLTVTGDYADAEPIVRDTIDLLGKVDQDENENIEASFQRIGLASNILNQGRLVEAELAAREALSFVLQSTNRQPTSESEAIFTLAQVMSAQNRDVDAVMLGRHALGILEKGGLPAESDFQRSGHFSLGLLLAAAKQWAEARKEFEQILGNSTGLSWTDRELATNPVVPLVMLKTGGGPGATPDELRKKVADLIAQFGEKHVQTAQMESVLAISLADSAPREALGLFKNALPVLTSRSRGSALNAISERSAEVMLDSILVEYVALLAKIEGTPDATGIDAVGEAFTIADVMRTRSVQDALNASAARASASNPELAGLARQEQDARQQIKALYGLLSTGTARTDKSVSDDLLTRIDTLRTARATLIETIERKYPDYATLIAPKPVTVADVQQVLQPDEAMVSILVGESQSYVWAVPASGAPSFAVVPMGESDLDREVATLRAALAPNASTLGEIPFFDTDVSYAIYQAFLAPVEAGWKSATTIQVVAHGALTQLPFGVLTTGPVTVDRTMEPLFSGYQKAPWLARSHAIASLPSALSLVTLRKLPPAMAGRKPLVAFGNPDFSGTVPVVAEAPAAAAPTQVATRGLPVHLRAAPKLSLRSSAQIAMLPPLPDTADEIEGIAVALKADPADLFLGKAASEGKVKSIDLSRFGVVVFATHGLVPGDLDGLTQPALALTPESGASGSDDGLLTMGEILALRLDADWVVLSACNTAAAEGSGAEAISGLGRAFFYAGSRALLVSNWPVETVSARTLTTDTFTRQAANPSESRAKSLQDAELALIDGNGYIDPSSGKSVFSYAHPIFWAPFSLIGDNRRQVN